MTSPLGHYAQIVAAIVSVVLIVGAMGAHLLGLADTTLVDAGFYMALGAIFGSFATVNGIKPDIAAANRRIDAMGGPPAASLAAENGNGETA